MQVDPICPDRQKEKERRKNGLALGNPSDRLDVKRMHGKERRDKQTSPRRARHALQEQIQNQGICRMKEQTDPMVPMRIESKKLNIQHVR